MADDTGHAILVTGGAGYVGAHACKALAGAGYRPVAFDDLSQGHRSAVQWGPLELGDLADRARLDSVLERHRPLAVMHFAALTSVAESVADPDRYMAVNVGGTRLLIDAMRDHGVGLMVFSSSAAVYGAPAAVPIADDAPTEPINPYGASKLDGERLIAGSGLRAVSLRYFNAAGADLDGEIGECHDPETHLIPLAIRAALGEGPPLTLYGDDYPTADGSCVRDYVHVSDLADAHCQALGHLERGGAGGAFNLGGGRGTSVRQILDAVGRATGRPVPHVVGPRRPGDPPELVSDIGGARRVLGWKPVRSDLEAIVASAVDWHRGRSQR